MADFIEDYNEITKRLNKCKNFDEFIRLSSTHSQMNYVLDFFECNNIEKLKKKKYHQRYDVNTEFMKNATLHAKISETILTILKNTKFPCTDLKISNNLIINNYKEIIYDCFNKFDSQSYYIIKKIFDDNTIFRINLKGYEGMCVNVMPLHRNYIFLKYKDNQDITTFLTLCHELGHAYENYLFTKQPSDLDYKRELNIFSECYSLLFENLMYDFLIDNKIAYKDAVIDQNKGYNFYVKELMMKIYMISNSYLNNAWYLDNNMFVSNIKSNLTKEYGTLSIKSEMSYAYGFLLAKHFINIMHSDLKTGKKMLNYFLQNKDLLNINDLFKNINLLDNNFDFIKESLNNNKENILKLTKKTSLYN